MFRFLASLIAILLALPTTVLCQRCWYPDGVTKSTDTPCNASASASPCCNVEDTCLDNGLCLHQGIISRGSCTDQQWKSDSCAQYCLDQPTGGVTLVPCNAWGGVFSCTWANCSQDLLFSVNGGSAVMLRDDQVAPLGSPAAVTVAATDVLRAATSTRSASSNGQSTEASNSGVAGARYTAGDMAAVGAGIGVPLALALAGTIFLLARQRRARPNQPHPQDSSQASNPLMKTRPSHYWDQPLGKQGHTTLHELGHTSIAEMNAHADRQELSALGNR